MLKPEFKTSARTVQWADRLAFMHNLINVVVGPFIAVVSLSTRNVSKVKILQETWSNFFL